MFAFGTVPSRRLGRSLGINNIPAKTCSYSCVYCQLGNTMKMLVDRQSFYQPERIYEEVKVKVVRTIFKGESIDYLTFVSEGEPTLDVALGEEIDLLKKLNRRIAIITNASLIHREDVRSDLAKADLVSLKVDAVSEDVWRKVNRPHGTLKLHDILEGIIEFADDFKGEIITETMLVKNLNDGVDEIEGIAAFLAILEPIKAYVAIPTRPPAEKWVKTVSEQVINMAYQTFTGALGTNRAEYLIGFEGTAFTYSGNVEEDLLSIISVHPMRRDAVEEFLKKASADWQVIRKLIEEDKLIELKYRGKKFYMKKLPSRD